MGFGNRTITLRLYVYIIAGLATSSLRPLRRVQNNAARLIYPAAYNVPAYMTNLLSPY